ncbi:small conductance calcium-activated potassium channel protein 2-like isoform X1 [Saccostrea echinata]|uniref:small conductance calcium-activated potassium channel protein 2-like isoform X1 n=1 Tax=Saccostrea echinata TaxID=191078 RepID=UPI002A817D9B|nr:small conductance calcium-activated potassium channel protein 2-like isoform X1 [Saccostrea echinata]
MFSSGSLGFQQGSNSANLELRTVSKNRMSGNTVLEDPGIPLVNRRNGKYSKYVEDDGQSTVTGTSVMTSKFDNISYRLSRRKVLLRYRTIIVNLEFTFAVLGIVLMLVETELFFQGVITKSSITSIVLKSCISVSTVFLLIGVIGYHVTGIQLCMTDNSLEDWRLAVNFPWTYLKVLLELAVCIIHPIPGNISVSAIDPDGKTREVSIDAILSILMLMRVYLLSKFMVVHSKLLTSTATQSLGALNKVKINSTFVFKALMSSMPGTVLVVIMLAILVVNSWAMRTCEAYYHPDAKNSNFFNDMWMIAITFLTVGYGDTYPNSYCGRFVSVATGLMGVGTTALLVAVLAQKLEQSRAEKYVHNFVTRAQLDKERKIAAADTIKYVLQLWRMRKNNENNGRKRIRLHGKLLQAIAAMKEAKNEKASIGETAIGFIEIAKSVNDIVELSETLQDTQSELKMKMTEIDSTIKDLQAKMEAVYNTVVR